MTTTASAVGVAATAGVAPAGAGASGPTNQTDQVEAVRAANRRRATTLCLSAGAVAGAVLGVIVGVIAGPIAGAVVAVVATAAAAALVRRIAVRAALATIGAAPVPEGSWPRVENMVDGLCASFGLSRPRLMVLEDPVPNACALGEQAAGVLVLTSSLVDRLDVMELEGVLAHELAHLKADDGMLAAVAVTVLGPWVALTGSTTLLHRAVGRGREYRADAIAVTTVRYPPGLQRALEGLADGLADGGGASPSTPSASYFATRRAGRTRWLWINPSVAKPPGRGAPSQTPDDGQLDAPDVRAAALADW